MEEKKKCKKCGQEKYLSEFHRDRTKKDGHKSVCKLCLSKKKNKVSGIDKNIKQSLRYCIKHDGAFRWSEILGYSKQELINHLKSEMTPEMTFENYGVVWGVTFHIPRRCYIFSKYWDNEFKKCWALKNLKPDFIINCKRQKAKISIAELEKYSLWDILPSGNIKDYLTD
mgnify:CR=1 FL=1